MNRFDDVEVAILRALIASSRLTSTELARKLYNPKDDRAMKEAESAVRWKLKRLAREGVVAKNGGPQWALCESVVVLDQAHVANADHTREWVLPNVALVPTQKSFYLIPF